MPEIIFEIPEHFKERTFRVFAGSEHVLYRYPSGETWVKAVRCNLCGKCCRVRPDWHLGIQLINGEIFCKHVRERGEEWYCEAPCAPFGCCTDNPKRPAHPDCSIRWEKVKAKEKEKD